MELLKLLTLEFANSITFAARILWFINSGDLKLVRLESEGQQLIVNLRPAGRWIGLASVIRLLNPPRREGRRRNNLRWNHSHDRLDNDARDLPARAPEDTLNNALLTHPIAPITLTNEPLI